MFVGKGNELLKRSAKNQITLPKAAGRRFAEVRSFDAGSDVQSIILRPLDQCLETAILDLLERRGAGKTICPSEAARQVAPDGWRALMEPARTAARRLAASGEIAVTQRGVEVDPALATGPIRLRRK